MGVFARMMEGLASEGGEKSGPMTSAGGLIGRAKGGLNTGLHAVTVAGGRPLRFSATISESPVDMAAGPVR